MGLMNQSELTSTGRMLPICITTTTTTTTTHFALHKRVFGSILVVWPLILMEFCAAKNSYIFIAPNVVRPGREFSVQGELIKDIYTPVQLSAELNDNGASVAKTETTVSRKQGVNLDLSVPTGWKPSSKNLKLIVKGTGGLTFSKTKNVDFEDKSVSVYIQTDKSTYKPGQTINMRIFGTTPELAIVYDKLKVEMYDAKGNKINQWDVSGAELTSLNGVYIQKQVLSDYPVLGEWKIQARLLSYGTEFTEKVIKVEKYVLPKFEVELDLPSFGRTKDTTFDGKVKAKYTFGKPIKGDASLTVEPKRRRFEWKSGKRVDVTKSYKMNFPVDGDTKFTIQMSDLENLAPSLSGNSLVFKVVVTETLTKAQQSDEQEVSFYSNPIKVEFPKSLPDTFKPMMKYDVVVKVSLRDDTPPEMTGEKLSVTVKEYGKVKNKEKCLPPRWRRRSIWRPPIEPCGSWTTEKVINTKTLTLDVPMDGVVIFSITPNKKVTKVRIEASYKGTNANLELKKRHSPSDSFIQITTRNKSPQAGSNVRFDVRSTKVPGTVKYQIYSKGNMVKSGTFSMISKTKTWLLPVTSLMAPRARIIVYYIRSDGEVIADALTINVQGIFKNKVTVQFNTTSARPANNITLDVTADPMSLVNVLAVDKSVLLLGTGNDISSDQVIGEINKFNTKSKKKNNNFCDWFCWRWPLPSGGEDVQDVFDEAGVIVITDTNVYQHVERIEPRPRPGPWLRRRMFRPMRMNAGIAFASAARPMAMDNAIRPVALAKSLPTPRLPSSTAELAPVKRVRKLFPETWLWKNATVPGTGRAVFDATVPDTITSWIATAFAIHPQSGLGLSQSPAQIQVSLPFFMMVNMPYAVIRGEKVVLQVNLHNYSPEPLFARLELSQSTDFENIEYIDGKEMRTSKNVLRTITVAKDEVVALYFPIVPTTIGPVKINVKAQALGTSDAVEKILKVEAEGAPREKSLSVLIDLETSGTYTEKVMVGFPPNAVLGSERVVAKVIGDIMGPSLDGLDSLLRMPYGCGEQNMLKFAPNIFIVKYLEATKNLKDDKFIEAKDFMEKGYQRELTYKHSDGSYSAFGERDDSGSTWLTAFVVKSFAQAKSYIFIDDAVVIKAVEWLIKQQDTDGTFKEPGRVIHKEMQGGSTGGKVSLTSYVLISLLEARVIKGVSSKVQAAADKAQAYLESQISSMNDVYDLAIVTYALQLVGSNRKQDVLNKLNTQAIIEGNTKHWEKTNSKPGNKSNRKGKAVNIELSAYGLLALTDMQDSIEGVKVLKWLSKQRNPDGGFMSTQDTVVALQALAEMAALIYRPVTNLKIAVSGAGFSKPFKIDNTNALVLQTEKLPSNAGEVTVTGSGVGLALIQIGIYYNIDVDNEKDSFMLKVTLPPAPDSMNQFKVEACASWTDTGSSSMAVIEIGAPSGFVPDSEMVISEPKYKRVEEETRKIVLYYDEITSRDTCVTVTMQRAGMVAGVMPVPVKVYDYYEPSKQVTEFYVPEVIKNSNVCDICGSSSACDFCPALPIN